MFLDYKYVKIWKFDKQATNLTEFLVYSSLILWNSRSQKWGRFQYDRFGSEADWRVLWTLKASTQFNWTKSFKKGSQIYKMFNSIIGNKMINAAIIFRWIRWIYTRLSFPLSYHFDMNQWRIYNFMISYEQHIFTEISFLFLDKLFIFTLLGAHQTCMKMDHLKLSKHVQNILLKLNPT